MKLYLCANRYTSEQTLEADRVRLSLEKQGFEFSALPSECDMVVSLGGDGAVLKAAKAALAADKPLAGINSGRLGYLCAMKVQDIDSFTEILTGARVSKRLVLETEVDGKRLYALNDVVFGKQFFGQTVELSVRADSREVLRVIGDGLIVSTPTGSTAYNRHAGGPVIMADVDALCLTPICSDSAPTVVGGGCGIEVMLKRGDCDVYVDGVKVDCAESSVYIRRSEKVLRLLLPSRLTAEDRS